jgi:replication factor C large subunit
LGSSKGNRNKRDYVARKIAEADGVSMSTARREMLPFLSAMTHHCKNRELTVAMAAKYDLEAKHVSFVTGSGKDTNKVGNVVESAEELREEAAVEHSGGAFEGATRSVSEQASGDDADADSQADSAGEADESTDEDSDDDAQAGLGDFG